MEFVIVTCRGEHRTVFIDNQEQGVTGQRLSVPEGLRVFDLGAPVDYTPPFQEILVEGTGPTDPLEVLFTPVTVFASVPERARKRSRKAPARTRKTKALKSRKRAAAKTSASAATARKGTARKGTARKGTARKRTVRKRTATRKKR